MGTRTIEHVVQFSGGAGSWYAARRVARRYGPDNVVLLCADTRSESYDWEEFVRAAAADVGAELVVVSAGVDWWTLADERGMIPNTRAGFCTEELKVDVLASWIGEHAPDATLHVGFDWTEEHRLEAMRRRWAPTPVEAPLLWSPMVDKVWVTERLLDSALPAPRAYRQGLPHNNCLRFGCAKAGLSYWVRLLEVAPETFARSERQEQKFRRTHGKDVAILRDRRGGKTRPLPLGQLRERHESGENLPRQEWGACGCFT